MINPATAPRIRRSTLNSILLAFMVNVHRAKRVQAENDMLDSRIWLFLRLRHHSSRPQSANRTLNPLPNSGDGP